MFKPRQFKSNPDLAARKVVEYNRFDRIPSPPVCGPEMLLTRRKLQKLNPRMRRFENICLCTRPRSLDNKKSTSAQEERDVPNNDEREEIRQLCQEFGQQMSLMK